MNPRQLLGVIGPVQAYVQMLERDDAPGPNGENVLGSLEKYALFVERNNAFQQFIVSRRIALLPGIAPIAYKPFPTAQIVVKIAHFSHIVWSDVICAGAVIYAQHTPRSRAGRNRINMEAAVAAWSAGQYTENEACSAGAASLPINQEQYVAQQRATHRRGNGAMGQIEFEPGFDVCITDILQ